MPEEDFPVRKLAFLLLLVGFCQSAMAATSVTVDQLEQMLTSLHNQRDEKIAEKLTGLELTERVTSARLAKWEADFTGKESRDALVGLSDAAAFLNLPAADIPTIEMPDPATRKKILMQTIEYVKTTIHKVPPCSARRSTTHFEDKPKDYESRVLHLSANGAGGNGMTADTVGFGSIASGTKVLHVLDRSTLVSTYRDGLEEAHKGSGWKAGPKNLGLSTTGEFGPILTTVVGDAIRGQIRWGRWEQGAAGPIAVLLYSVPQEISHYALSVGAAVGKSGQPQAPTYHGEIAVDPATGNILRLTIETELKPPHEVFDSSIELEYGPVSLGNATYICPIKGVALSKVSYPSEDPKSQAPTAPPQIFMNDVSFTEFGAVADAHK
jgi:hypothetical protein